MLLDEQPLGRKIVLEFLAQNPRLPTGEGENCSLERILAVVLFFPDPLGIAKTGIRRIWRERLQNGLAIFTDSGQKLNTLLRLAQLGLTAFNQSHAEFIASQRVFQADLTVFQVANNMLKLGQRFFQGKFVRRRISHALTSRSSSTRLTMVPCRRTVTIRSPGRTCSGLRTTG